MKKIYLLFAVLFFAASAFAQPTLTIKKLNTLPVVTDGVFDEIWDNVDEVAIETQVDGDYGEATLEAFFKMAYNDTALFICVNRADDEDLADQWVTGIEGGDWKSDRDELFFDVYVDTLDDGVGASNSQRDADGATYGHYQLLSIWVETTLSNPQVFRNTGASCWYHYRTYYLGYNFVSPAEYDCEYVIPFTSFNWDAEKRASATFASGHLEPQAGVTFGFEIVNVDVDMYDSPTDENFRKFMRWANVDGWGNLDGAGKITFSEEMVIGINDRNADFNVTVYPSPATEQIRLKNLTGAVDIEIYNILGRVVQSQKNVLSDTKIDVNSLSQGVYFIQVGDEGTVKFIKE